MESVAVLKRRGVLGLGLAAGKQLCSCYRWFVVVVTLLLSNVWLVPADCLQPIDNERSSVWSIVDAGQSGTEGSSTSLSDIGTNSLHSEGSSLLNNVAIEFKPKSDEDRIILWELPIVEEEGEKQAVVVCNVKCFRVDPVCGEDAVTYWCGAAEAKCAGVDVAYKGYCDSRSGGTGKDGTRATQSLFLVHLIWLVLAGFLVVADLL